RKEWESRWLTIWSRTGAARRGAWQSSDRGLRQPMDLACYDAKQPDPAGKESALVQKWCHLRAPCAGFSRQLRRRHRGFSRFDFETGLLARLGSDGSVAAALLSLAPEGRRLRHCRLLRSASVLWDAHRFQGVLEGGPSPRTSGHHGIGDESHLGPSSVVPEVSPCAAWEPLAELLCLERHF